MKSKKIYVVIAYKWGDRECHSYTVGVFTKKHKAQQVAEEHCNYRGGKYACTVEECQLDYFDNTDNQYSKEIYRAKSIKQ